MNRLLLALTLSLTTFGCSQAPSPSPAPSHRAFPSHNAVPAPSATDAVAQLDRLDTRAPVPLLPMMAEHQKQNMRDHLVAVQEIVAAVAANDFAAVERAAGRIGSSESMQRMCSHMGAGAPGFSDQALAFHQTADRIGAAARDQAHDRVLSELSTTLQACTACHTRWKQKVVGEL